MRHLAIILAATLAAVGCSNEHVIRGDSRPVEDPSPRSLGGESQSDRIVQITNPEVDVLFLIDNSCSMADKQNKLANNFPLFMQYFLGSGLDYHIGTIATDMNTNGFPEAANSRGRLRERNGVRYIDPDTPNPATVFSNMAAMGTGGTYDEKGRAPIMMALDFHRDGWNAGYQRDNAALHIIAVSDEDDHTGGTFGGAGGGGSYHPSRAEFLQFLQTLKPGGQDMTFSSIVNPPGSPPLGEETGHEYIAYTQAIGGILWDIQSQDWAPLLDQLGLQALGLRREFFLSSLPVPGSIKVAVIEEGVQYAFDEEVDWTYNQSRNSVTFTNFVPQPMSEVLIDYDVLAAHQGG